MSSTGNPEVSRRMALSLERYARENGKDLRLVKWKPDGPWQSQLDDLFDDGGFARCEKFCDLSISYALRFGKLDSDPFSNAQWACIERAISMLHENHGGQS